MPNYSSIGLIILLLLTGSARGTLRLTAETEEVPERGPVPRYLASFEGRQFSFMPPPNWSSRLDPQAGTVQLLHPKQNAALTISFSPGGQPDPQGRLLEEELERRYPGAEIIERFSSNARDVEGQSIEARFTAADGSTHRVRLARFDYPSITVTLVLAAEEALLSTLHASWTYTLNSLAAGPR